MRSTSRVAEQNADGPRSRLSEQAVSLVRIGHSVSDIDIMSARVRDAAEYGRFSPTRRQPWLLDILPI